MSYQRQNFQDGDILKAEHLNRIEDGLVEMEKQEGPAGVGIQSIEQTVSSNVDGGANIVTVTMTDGSKATFSVKNGNKGNDGAAGAAGKTPVKGTDYYTQADKNEMVNLVLGAMPTWTGGSY